MARNSWRGKTLPHYFETILGKINSPHILTENDTKQGILLGMKMSFCYIYNWST